MASGIYAITNTINGHKYIGSAVDVKARWRCHRSDLNNDKHHSMYLQRAWNKYGADGFVFSVLEYCDSECLIEKEQFYLDNEHPEYNILPVAGSPLGVSLSEETKLRISKSKSGENCSAETRKRLSEAKKGKPSPRKGAKLSEETRAKISAVQIGKEVSDETRAKMRASSKHKPPTEEHKAKLSAQFTGIPLSEEHRKKLSAAHMGNQSGHGNLGRKHSDEHREKVSKAITEWWRKRKEEAHV